MNKNTMRIFIAVTLVLIAAIVAWFKMFTITENRVLGKFSEVTVNGPIQVFLLKDMGDTIRLEADKGLHSLIFTRINGEELIIQPTADIRHERVLKVYLSSNNIKKLKLLGASTVEVVNKIENDTLEVSLEQSAEARVLADCGYIKVTLSDASNIFMAGKADNLSMSLSGFSDVVAYKLESKNCTLSIRAPDQSPGIFRVSASDTLRVSMSAPHSRIVYYKGNPFVIVDESIIDRIVKK
jgi:hypothetical protein